MKHYIDPKTNNIYAYEDDGSQDGIIPDTYQRATIAQLDAVQNPPVEPNDLIKQMIANLEATITPRRMREAMLTDAGKAWLTDIDTHIASLRSQLA